MPRPRPRRTTCRSDTGPQTVAGRRIRPRRRQDAPILERIGASVFSYGPAGFRAAASGTVRFRHPRTATLPDLRYRPHIARPLCGSCRSLSGQTFRRRHIPATHPGIARKQDPDAAQAQKKSRTSLQGPAPELWRDSAANYFSGCSTAGATAVESAGAGSS